MTTSILRLVAFLAAGLLPAAPLASGLAQSGAPSSTQPGTEILSLGEGALLLVPASLPRDRPVPLVVMLHGAVGGAPLVLQRFGAVAESAGVALLAPASRGATWDMIVNLRDAMSASGRIAPRPPQFGADPARIDAAIERAAAHLRVDRRHLVLGGFSDGASYALTLGLRRPAQFRTIIAFSPGMMFAPGRLDRTQRIYISHGRQDRVLPFGGTADTIVPGLRRLGFDVAFRPFDGDHVVPPDVQAEAFALAATAPASAPE